MECVICGEEVLRLVACPCGFTACSVCTKRYVLESRKEAGCMQCGLVWTRTFLIGAMGAGWVGDNGKGGYRKHEKDVLMERERALVPKTLGEMEVEKEAEAAKASELSVASRRVEEATMELTRAKRFLDHANEAARMARAEFESLQKHLRVETRRLREARRANYAPLDAEGRFFLFLFPCPGNCNGMIEKERATCTVCEKKACVLCRNETGPSHVCDPTEAKNVKAIEKESKPCPTCSIPISKVSGCDQMWCPKCKTAFSWNTGKTDSGSVHNPHALEWARRTGGNLRRPQGGVCGGLPQRHELSFSERAALFPPLRCVAEAANWLENDRGPKDLGDIRRKFLKGETSEETWREKTFKRERANSRANVQRQLLRTFVDVSTGMFVERVGGDGKSLEAFLGELGALTKYVNETMVTEVSSYGGTKFQGVDTNTWHWKRPFGH